MSVCATELHILASTHVTIYGSSQGENIGLNFGSYLLCAHLYFHNLACSLTVQGSQDNLWSSQAVGNYEFSMPQPELQVLKCIPVNTCTSNL